MKPDLFLSLASQYSTFQKMKQELGEMGAALQMESTKQLSLRYCNKDLSPETVNFMKVSLRSMIDTALEDLNSQMYRIELVFQGVEVDRIEPPVVEGKSLKDNRSFAIRH
jgi:hypothetical protein